MPNILENRTWLFEFGDDAGANISTELQISNLIYVFLLFEAHGYVVSSNRSAGQYLAIQDGFVYFYSSEEEIKKVKQLLENFERRPLASPQWILDFIIEGQV